MLYRGSSQLQGGHQLTGKCAHGCEPLFLLLGTTLTTLDSCETVGSPHRGLGQPHSKTVESGRQLWVTLVSVCSLTAWLSGRGPSLPNWGPA